MANFTKELLEKISCNEYSQLYLDLSRQDLSVKDTLDLSAALKQNTHVKYLDASVNDIGDEGAQALIANAKLFSINLDSCSLTDKTSFAIKENHTLNAINLNFNSFSEHGLKNLLQSPSLRQLQIAYPVEHVNINNKDNILNGTSLLQNTFKLTLLDISCNPVSYDVIKKLCQKSELKVLGIAHCNISDEQVVELAEILIPNHSIECLNLSYNQIKDSGAKALAELMRVNPTIRYLNLKNNDISLVGAGALTKIGTNESTDKPVINLYENNVAEDTVIKLLNGTTLNDIEKRFYPDFTS